MYFIVNDVSCKDRQYLHTSLSIVKLQEYKKKYGTFLYLFLTKKYLLNIKDKKENRNLPFQE
jgi:hypothetical protein